MSASAPGPARNGASAVRRRRPLAALSALALLVILGGCQLPTFDAFRGSTTQAHDEFTLWSATFIAAIVVGVITGALILWSIIRYRHRAGSDEIPRQFQYHGPIEVAYTVIPIVIVLVLFGFTVIAENHIDAVIPNPAVKINVWAFQWGWEFQYPGQNITVEGQTTNDPDPVGLDGASCAPAVDCLGPGLILPANATVRITLQSKDTIHGFYVPQFNFSRYAQPGVMNQFDFNVVHPGVYRAQCTQFCGLYHSIMFFHVVALPNAQFQTWVHSEQQASSSSSANSNSPSSSGSPSYSAASGVATEAKHSSRSSTTPKKAAA